MFGWLKKKHRPATSGELEAFAKKWLGPQSLIAAIAETVGDYVDDVQAGRVTYPAHRREGASVVDIWRDLRLEALERLFNFGEADAFLLSDQRQQLGLLACFIDERPHLEMPQPRGETIPDTIQAMWQVYVYLDAVGSEVADRETDRATLKLSGHSILDNLTTQAKALRERWQAFENAVRSGEEALPEMPRTLIEVLYEDVTGKAKSVALSTVFGPSYENGIKYLEKLVAEKGERAADVRATIDRVLAAKDPDEFMGK